MTEFDPKKEKKYKRTLDLIRAKYEFYEADASEDDWIFEKDSIEDIIRASIEILDNSLRTVFSGILLSTERTFQFFHGDNMGVSRNKIIENTQRITIISEIITVLFVFITY